MVVFSGLFLEARPETRADFAVELKHVLGNEPRQQQVGFALLVDELQVSLAGEPSVEKWGSA
jgi:hypothetical protein